MLLQNDQFDGLVVHPSLTCCRLNSAIEACDRCIAALTT